MASVARDTAGLARLHRVHEEHSLETERLRGELRAAREQLIAIKEQLIKAQTGAAEAEGRACDEAARREAVVARLTDMCETLQNEAIHAAARAEERRKRDLRDLEVSLRAKFQS